MPGKNNEESFFGTLGASDLFSKVNDFNGLRDKIRYLAEQWNFSVEQRIQNAVTIE